MNPNGNPKMNRRNFLELVTAATAGTLLPGCVTSSSQAHRRARRDLQTHFICFETSEKSSLSCCF
jgi:hypothetical protein